MATRTKLVKAQTTQKDLLAILRVNMPELKERFDVQNLWPFGSYARKETHIKSDLDLLVEFRRAPSMFEFVRLERLLSEKVGVKVDLVMKSALKPDIGARILQEIIPV